MAKGSTDVFARTVSLGPRRPGVTREEVDGAPEPGTRVGPYVVIGAIGEGGMGIVLTAYDPRLDRKVAIKFVRPQVKGDHRAKQQKLLDEAKSLAKVSHPHVVTVFDVGTWEDRVYIAMERLEGESLRDWLRPGRGWRKATELLVQAGRGLVAAHERDILHGDFKPENVFVTTAGSARVLDFGLTSPAYDSSDLDTTVTGEGAARPYGTPPYIAPEMYDGAVATLQSDQYAFCIAAYEALYGRYPFEVEDPRSEASLLEGKRAERLLAPPSGPVPRAVWAAIRRGLVADPTQRWPSMDQLLTELERLLARRRNLNLALAGGVGAAVAVAITAVVWPRSAGPVCDGGDARLATLWPAERRVALAEHFGASDRPYAADVWARGEARLEAYLSRWSAVHRDACEATHVRGEQSAELLDLRMVCLERAATEFDALLHVLVGAGDRGIDRAIDAIAGLPDVEACRDAASLLAATAAPPTGAGDRVAQVRHQLAAAKAEYRLDDLDKALERSTGALQAAEELGYEPLLAEARLRLGLVRRDRHDTGQAEDLLRDAYFAAQRVGDYTLASEAAIGLAQLVGRDAARLESARDWLAHAEANAGKTERAARHRAAIDGVRGMLARNAGDLDASLAAVRREVAALEELYGPDAVELYPALDSLALALIDKGQYEEARAPLERARAIIGREVAPDHVDAARIEGHLGALRSHLGDTEAALAHYQRALAMFEEIYEPDNPILAAPLNNLASTLLRADRVEEGRAHLERAVELWSKRSEDRARLAAGLLNLAVLANRAGDLEQAIALARRSLAIREALHEDAPHPDIASAHNNLGLYLWQAGELDAAWASLERAQEIRDHVLGPDHPLSAEPRANRGLIATQRGQLTLAVELLEDALRIERVALGEHPQRVKTLLALVDAESRRGRRAQVLAHLEEADRICAATQVPPRLALRVQRGLAEHLARTDAARARRHVEAARAIVAKTGGDAAELEAWVASLRL